MSMRNLLLLLVLKDSLRTKIQVLVLVLASLVLVLVLVGLVLVLVDPILDKSYSLI